MKDEKYTKIFEELNIPTGPLPENYTPDEFMRKLLLKSSTWNEQPEVSYSTSTDSNIDLLDPVPVEPCQEWIWTSIIFSNPAPFHKTFERSKVFWMRRSIQIFL